MFIVQKAELHQASQPNRQTGGLQMSNTFDFLTNVQYNTKKWFMQIYGDSSRHACR
jgi:hypothetical protein